MFETICFLTGLGFSFLVYFTSIRKAGLSRSRKTLYFFLTLVGITGMIFLSGVLIADFVRRTPLFHK